MSGPRCANRTFGRLAATERFSPKPAMTVDDCYNDRRCWSRSPRRIWKRGGRAWRPRLMLHSFVCPRTAPSICSVTSPSPGDSHWPCSSRGPTPAMPPDSPILAGASLPPPAKDPMPGCGPMRPRQPRNSNGFSNPGRSRWESPHLWRYPKRCPACWPAPGLPWPATPANSRACAPTRSCCRGR